METPFEVNLNPDPSQSPSGEQAAPSLDFFSALGLSAGIAAQIRVAFQLADAPR